MVAAWTLACYLGVYTRTGLAFYFEDSSLWTVEREDGRTLSVEGGPGASPLGGLMDGRRGSSVVPRGSPHGGRETPWLPSEGVAVRVPQRWNKRGCVCVCVCINICIYLSIFLEGEI